MTSCEKQQITVNFAFCAHVDTKKIETHSSDVFLSSNADYFSFSPQRACNGKTIGSHLNWNFQRGWGVFDKIPSVGGGTCMDIFWNYTIKVKLTSISQTELTCTLNCCLTKTVHV